MITIQWDLILYYEKEDWKTIIIQYTEHNSMRFNFNCEKEDWKTIIIQYMEHNSMRFNFIDEKEDWKTIYWSQFNEI